MPGISHKKLHRSSAKLTDPLKWRGVAGAGDAVEMMIVGATATAAGATTAEIIAAETGCGIETTTGPVGADARAFRAGQVATIPVTCASIPNAAAAAPVEAAHQLAAIHLVVEMAMADAHVFQVDRVVTILRI